MSFVDFFMSHALVTSRLLDILAGRKDTSRLSGVVLVNGVKQPENFKCITGYVVQVSARVSGHLGHQVSGHPGISGIRVSRVSGYLGHRVSRPPGIRSSHHQRVSLPTNSPPRKSSRGELALRTRVK